MKNNQDMSNFFKGKNVLVTGHTGFKGAWLTEILTLWGANVTGVALKPHTQPNLFTILELEKKIKHYEVDIRNLDELKKVFSEVQPEIVFHLAAQAIVKVSFAEPLLTFETNVMGTANVLQSIRETSSVKSAVIITSDKVYENVEWVYPYREIDRLGGHDPYGASKAAADITIQSFIKSFFNTDSSPLVAITRAGNVIGGGDWSPYRIVPDIIRAVYDKNEPVTLRSPKSIRPWQCVLEPLSGYLLLAQKLFEGDRSLVSAWNFGPNDEHFIPVLEIVKRGMAILGKGEYRIEEDKTFHEFNLLKLDTSKSRSLLGWKPSLQINETMDYTFGWYKNYYEQNESVAEFTDKQIASFFSKS